MTDRSIPEIRALTRSIGVVLRRRGNLFAFFLYKRIRNDYIVGCASGSFFEGLHLAFVPLEPLAKGSSDEIASAPRASIRFH